jgi:hypothetical protein
MTVAGCSQPRRPPPARPQCHCQCSTAAAAHSASRQQPAATARHQKAQPRAPTTERLRVPPTSTPPPTALPQP